MPKNDGQQNLSAPSPPGETVDKIVQDCGLANTFAQSVCLHCNNRVLAMDAQKRATLYCKELYRDVEVAITACTHLTNHKE